jgi:hypothetical protein
MAFVKEREENKPALWFAAGREKLKGMDVMEVERFFVKPDNTADIKCPYCRTVKTVPVTKIKDPKKVIEVKCLCRKIFKVILEFRKMYRKEVELRGRYVNQSRENDEGSIIISNISLNGLGFHVVGAHKIGQDNILNVEFRLDDDQKTFIAREVRVREVQGNFAGVEFVNVDRYDKYLEFYLIP